MFKSSGKYVTQQSYFIWSTLILSFLLAEKFALKIDLTATSSTEASEPNGLGPWRQQVYISGAVRKKTDKVFLSSQNQLEAAVSQCKAVEPGNNFSLSYQRKQRLGKHLICVPLKHRIVNKKSAAKQQRNIERIHAQISEVCFTFKYRCCLFERKIFHVRIMPNSVLEEQLIPVKTCEDQAFVHYSNTLLCTK